MKTVTLTINGEQFTVPDFLSVRKAALKNKIYVPGLCSHPELNPFKPFSWSERVWQGETEFGHEEDPSLSPPTLQGEKSEDNSPSISQEEKEGDGFPHCNLCMVSVNSGESQRACTTKVADGMEIRTTGDDLIEARRKALAKILAYHPHACLTCAQREGCDRIQCSMDVPVEERCCELLGRCEIGKVSDFIGIPNDTPAYRNEKRPSITNEPLFLRDYELCIGCTRCVRICRDIRGVDVLGAVMLDGRIKIGTSGGAGLDESLCKFCTACVAVCPTGALRDQPGVQALTRGVAPCSSSCPLGIDIPGYIELIADGKPYESLELIRERAVLPGVLGYACFHPCEENCRRDALEQSVSICALKRYVSDIAGEREPRINKLPSTGKKVAVIGGGPAGLATAAELLRHGHAVTIIERDTRLGGMLRQTIPEFRLPDSVIERDLSYLFALGLETQLGIELGKDTDFDKLRNEGFDAIVVTVGLSEAVRLGVEGENFRQVETGLDFLRKGEKQLDGKVVIIGGGAVAVDAAMTARRLGSDSVTMICLESPDEIPAFAEELDAAKAEGLEILYRWGVDRIEGNNGQVEQVALKRCTQVFDKQGKFSPEYNPDETMTVPADWVIVAIGQKLEGEILHFVQNDNDDLFSAGDAVTGPTSIVSAMADGVRVAEEVDKYLGGSEELPATEYPIGEKLIGRDKEFHTRSRVIMDHLSSEERVKTLALFTSTYLPDQAITESARCLRCHLRASILPSPLPPDPWREFGEYLLDEVPSVEGVLIFADEDKISTKIAGSADINEMLSDLIDDEFDAEYCRWELDPMYTKRESELIQAHLQAFGEIPGDDELDDLF